MKNWQNKKRVDQKLQNRIDYFLAYTFKPFGDGVNVHAVYRGPNQAKPDRAAHPTQTQLQHTGYNHEQAEQQNCLKHLAQYNDDASQKHSRYPPPQPCPVQY